ncbi:restriction endonuclease subunit S [Vibrio cholerae]|nr:restriction endonuclease subunit S [Vibrio cholerae]
MGFKPLGEIVSVKGGKRLPKGSTLQEEPNSHPYIRVKDMGARYIPRSGLEFVPEDVFPKISRYTVNTNDVIISIVGTIGLVSVIDEFFDNASQTENCAKLTGLDKVDALYLYYFLRSEAGQSEIKMGTVGAVQAKLPLYNIEKLSIYWPLREVRQKIVSQLSTIDDKLECNAQTNQTLEQIAQAIFKSWFVDFDPVKAKIEALAEGDSADDAELAAMRVISAKTLDELNSLKASNPEAFNKLAQTATLFPAAMQDSELGEIPVGWEVKQLKDILELAYGKALKKTDRVDGDVPVYGSGGLTGYHNQSLVEGPGIIVGRKGTVGSVYWEPKAFYPIDTVFYVKPRAGYSLKYCHLVLQNLGLKDMNTDAAVPGLNRDNAYRLDVITPTKDVMNLFKEIMQSLQSNVDANNAQSASLESLRDTLLPKLLSGEIDLTSEVTA